MAGELRCLACHRHVGGVLLAVAVREVQSEDVGPRPDQLRHPFDGARGGPDRGDDLGPPGHGRGGVGWGLAGLGGHSDQALVLGRVSGSAAGVGGSPVAAGAVSGPFPPLAVLGRGLQRLDVGEAPGDRCQHQPHRDREQAQKPLPGRQQLEVEELAHRAGGEGERVKGAEPGDQREHVALDRDVLAARPALEQEDEAEPEHDQGGGCGRAALGQRAGEDLVDHEEGEKRARPRSRPRPAPRKRPGRAAIGLDTAALRSAPARVRTTESRSSAWRRSSAGEAGMETRRRRSP